jgi:hypothetical protein
MAFEKVGGEMCKENKENLQLSLIVLFCALLACVVTTALRAEEPDQMLSRLSQNIQLKLNEAKLKSENLSRQLTEAQRDLELSQGQRIRYQQTSERLKISLDNTIGLCGSLSESLEKSRVDLVVERERVRARNRILLWHGIAGGVIILGKVAAFILYLKHVPIPRWLDIVL